MNQEIIDLLRQILNVLTIIVTTLTSIFGVMAMIVKFVKTLPTNSIFLPIIKILGKITNNQTDDNAIRANMKI